MGNRRLVTRELGGVPSQRHLGSGPSLGPVFSAARTSKPAAAIGAANAIRATQINFPGDSQKSTHLNVLQRGTRWVYVPGVMAAPISAYSSVG